MANGDLGSRIDISKLGSGERRRSARHSFTAAADVMEPNSHLRISARTSELDHQGCYIDTFNPFPEGANLVVRIGKERLSFNTMATVIHAQPGMGMGVAFDALAPEQVRVLEQWVGPEMVKKNPEPPAAAAQKQVTNDPLPQVSVPSAPAQQPIEALKYLVLMLIQKGVLAEVEGRLLLEKLLS